jgi:hypothetical protein
MGNFTTIKLTASELKLINDNYYKTGQEKKWKSKRAEKKNVPSKFCTTKEKRGIWKKIAKNDTLRFMTEHLANNLQDL